MGDRDYLWALPPITTHNGHSSPHRHPCTPLPPPRHRRQVPMAPDCCAASSSQVGSGAAAASSSASAASAAAAAVRTVNHELSVFFQPGTSKVRTARLAPDVVNVSGVVHAAQEPSRGLAFLVREAQALLARHWRRQLLIDAAGRAFPLAPSPQADAPHLLIATLPNKAQAELCVPLGWPDAGADPAGRLSLVGLTPPAPGVSTAAAEEEVRRLEADAALGTKGLVDFLSAVYDATTKAACV